MNLLIVTQKVDKNDPILGFFHRWIESFGNHCEHVEVIGQFVGAHHFAQSVSVSSLQKEKGTSNIAQVFRFWKLLWQKKTQYDVVLVHMTPIWIVLGAPLWIFLRKRMYLWYEARGARWPLRAALLFVCKVFSASTAGMPLHTRKSVVVGHGIDTEQFAADGSVTREHGRLVTVGRITKSKHIETMLRALSTLPTEYQLTIVGKPITSADNTYMKELQELMNQAVLRRRVAMQSLPHHEVISVLQRAEVFVHASETSLDKALLEAMAAGCLVVSSSEAGRLVLPELCQATPETLPEVLQNLVSLPDHAKQELRQNLRHIIEQQHSLDRLVTTLCSEMTA